MEIQAVGEREALNTVPGLSIRALWPAAVYFRGMSVSPVEQVLNPLYHCSGYLGPEDISGAGALVRLPEPHPPTPNFTRSQCNQYLELKLRTPGG